MGPHRQPPKGSELRRPPVAPARRSAGPLADASPRHGFAPVSPRHGLATTSGLPAALKANIEAMSGFAMDDVHVHRNSGRPAVYGALAYTQGTDIHVAPGQERHLPHEAWHVVQQKQGRVTASRQMKSGEPLNDDPGLEREADLMAARASSTVADAAQAPRRAVQLAPVVQRKPFVANAAGELVDVATAPAAAVAAILDGFWAAGKWGKITEAVSVAAIQRTDVMEAVSDGVATDIAETVAKPKLLVEVIASLWKKGAENVEQVLPPDLAREAVSNGSVQAALKAIGGHPLLNAVQGAKLEGATASALDKDALADAIKDIDAMTFATALTEEFGKKHIAAAQTVEEASKKAHEAREKARKKRVSKTQKAAPADPKAKRKALRSADQAISTRFLFPDDEQALIVQEVQRLNRSILKKREANPRAIYRLTKNAYTFVSVFKQQGEETGKARFWYTVLGEPGAYRINHLDALADA